MLFAAVHRSRLDQSGQRWILAHDGLSAFDPERRIYSELIVLPRIAHRASPRVVLRTPNELAVELGTKRFAACESNLHTAASTAEFGTVAMCLCSTTMLTT
jgi:hypothetical protein